MQVLNSSADPAKQRNLAKRKTDEEWEQFKRRKHTAQMDSTVASLRAYLELNDVLHCGLKKTELLERAAAKAVEDAKANENSEHAAWAEGVELFVRQADVKAPGVAPRIVSTDGTGTDGNEIEVCFSRVQNANPGDILLVPTAPAQGKKMLADVHRVALKFQLVLIDNAEKWTYPLNITFKAGPSKPKDHDEFLNDVKTKYFMRNSLSEVNLLPHGRVQFNLRWVTMQALCMACRSISYPSQR